MKRWEKGLRLMQIAKRRVGRKIKAARPVGRPKGRRMEHEALALVLMRLS